MQAQQSQSLQDKEAARRSVEQLAAQQQKLLADLNSDVATQRKSKSARESFLEMQLKEAARKEQQLSKKAAQLVRGRWPRALLSFLTARMLARGGFGCWEYACL